METGAKGATESDQRRGQQEDSCFGGFHGLTVSRWNSKTTYLRPRQPETRRAIAVGNAGTCDRASRQKPPKKPDPAEETLRQMIRKFQNDGDDLQWGRIEKEVFGVDFED